MTKDESQKNDLLLFLELFKELEGLPCDFGDKPDLVVTSPSGLIGIEHTHLYFEDPELKSGQQLRPQEKIHFQITDKAHQLFRRTHSIPLYLTVDFGEPSNYRTRDVPEVAAALSLAVHHSFIVNQRQFVQGHRIRIDAWRFEDLGFPFPRGVTSFHYSVVEPNRGFELWGPVAGYCVPHLSITAVESVIHGKESLIDSYFERCDKCWLLITTDAGWRSSHFDVPTEVTDHRYRTRFERVFLMTIVHRILSELTT